MGFIFQVKIFKIQLNANLLRMFVHFLRKMGGP